MSQPTHLPADFGYRMPAEWAPHTATWMSWPFDDEMWFGNLRQVRAEYTELVKTIAKVESVHLLLRDNEAAETASKALAGVHGVTIHRIPLNDAWLRDNGAIFVHAAGQKQAAVNWRFNAWGGK